MAEAKPKGKGGAGMLMRSIGPGKAKLPVIVWVAGGSALVLGARMLRKGKGGGEAVAQGAVVSSGPALSGGGGSEPDYGRMGRTISDAIENALGAARPQLVALAQGPTAGAGGSAVGGQAGNPGAAIGAPSLTVGVPVPKPPAAAGPAAPVQIVSPGGAEGQARYGTSEAGPVFTPPGAKTAQVIPLTQFVGGSAPSWLAAAARGEAVSIAPGGGINTVAPK